MNCKEFSDLLDAFMEGALSDRQASDLQSHAEGCARCRTLLQLRQDCRKADEDTPVPLAFSAAWRQVVRKEKAAPPRVWRAVLTAAAALVLVLGGVMAARRVPLSAKDAGASVQRAQKSEAQSAAPMSTAMPSFAAKESTGMAANFAAEAGFTAQEEPEMELAEETAAAPAMLALAAGAPNAAAFDVEIAEEEAAFEPVIAEEEAAFDAEMAREDAVAEEADALPEDPAEAAPAPAAPPRLLWAAAILPVLAGACLLIKRKHKTDHH